MTYHGAAKALTSSASFSCFSLFFSSALALSFQSCQGLYSAPALFGPSYPPDGWPGYTPPLGGDHGCQLLHEEPPSIHFPKPQAADVTPWSKQDHKLCWPQQCGSTATSVTHPRLSREKVWSLISIKWSLNFCLIFTCVKDPEGMFNPSEVNRAMWTTSLLI